MIIYIRLKVVAYAFTCIDQCTRLGEFIYIELLLTPRAQPWSNKMRYILILSYWIAIIKPDPFITLYFKILINPLYCNASCPYSSLMYLSKKLVSLNPIQQNQLSIPDWLMNVM